MISFDLEKTLTTTMRVDVRTKKLHEIVLARKEGDNRDMLAIVSINELHSVVVVAKENAEGDYVFNFRDLNLTPPVDISYFRITWREKKEIWEQDETPDLSSKK